MYATTVLIGCAVSVLMTITMWLTRLGFLFPPFLPGLLFSWVVIIIRHGESWTKLVGISIATLGNAALYSWLSYPLIKADVLARGPLGRFLLR
jgi:Na+/glutamate symporter